MMLDKLQWTVLAITILFQFSCVCNKVPDITWDIDTVPNSVSGGG